MKIKKIANIEEKNFFVDKDEICFHKVSQKNLSKSSQFIGVYKITLQFIQ